MTLVARSLPCQIRNITASLLTAETASESYELPE